MSKKTNETQNSSEPVSTINESENTLSEGVTTKDQSGDMQTGNKNRPAYLQKFFLDQLKDIYYAEQKLGKALPAILEACTTTELEEAFTDHLAQTQKHVRRIERVFDMVGEKPAQKKCEAMDGLLREVENIISETPAGSMTRDAALIIAAQKVEHYEIASYGGLVQLAVTMDMREAADVLDKTLTEVENNDRLLTHIAEGYINMKADQES